MALTRDCSGALQDAESLLRMARRRCADEKAAVRKGALSLLEALVVMRATWQGYTRAVPGDADLALLEGAASQPTCPALFEAVAGSPDAEVSVRAGSTRCDGGRPPAQIW